MSLFNKNVPLKEEEVAPVMQEYSGQHPMLNFKSVSAIVKPDHLDQYMEVRPFESSEPKLVFRRRGAKKTAYDALMKELNSEYRFDFNFTEPGSVLIGTRQEPLTLEVVQINDANTSRVDDRILYLPVDIKGVTVDIKGVKTIEDLSKKIKDMTDFATNNTGKVIIANSKGGELWTKLKEIVYVPADKKCSYKIK